MEPMEATVAVLEPVTAAKPAQLMKAVTRSPPGRRESHFWTPL